MIIGGYKDGDNFGSDVDGDDDKDDDGNETIINFQYNALTWSLFFYSSKTFLNACFSFYQYKHQ